MVPLLLKPSPRLVHVACIDGQDQCNINLLRLKLNFPCILFVYDLLGCNLFRLNPNLFHFHGQIDGHGVLFRSHILGLYLH